MLRRRRYYHVPRHGCGVAQLETWRPVEKLDSRGTSSAVCKFGAPGPVVDVVVVPNHRPPLGQPAPGALPPNANTRERTSAVPAGAKVRLSLAIGTVRQ